MNDKIDMEKAIKVASLKTAERMINSFLDAQEQMSPDGRVKVWNFLQKDYCRDCGEKTSGSRCNCCNDE